MKDMNTSIAIGTATRGTKRDILIAWETATASERLMSDWINNVDSETMNEVRVIWKCINGKYSMHDTFVLILKTCK